MILHEITDRLYMSSNPQARHVPELREAGITAVVCLCRRSHQEVRELVQVYYYAPIADGQPKATQVEELVDLTVHLIGMGHTVLVHCNAGRNRSGLVATLALMRILNVNGAVALSAVRGERPRAVANRAFEDYILARNMP